jgi:MFS family permease
MDQVTRGWLIYQLTDSPLQLGLVSAIRAVPLLFFSVLAGVVADRYGRKAQLVISQLTNAGLNFILGVLVLTHQVHPWHVYATGLLAGVVMAFQQPARQAMLSDLVDEEHITNAIGLNSMVFNASRSIGPAVAGVIIAGYGTAGSYLVQGVIFALATVWTLQMHVPEPTSASAQSGGRHQAARRPQASIWSSTLEGGRYIWSNSAIRLVMLVVLIPSLLGQPYTSLMPVFARDILNVGSTGQGILLTAVGIGALIGSIAVASIGNTGRQGVVMLCGAILFGLTITGFALSQWFLVSVVLMAISGLCNVSYGTQANTVLQIHTPSELRGRVMGVYFLSRGLVPMGALLAGAVATVLGAPLTVAIMGASCAGLALWVLITSPKVRDLR